MYIIETFDNEYICGKHYVETMTIDSNDDDSRTKEVVHQKYFYATFKQKHSDELNLLDDQHLR